MELEPYQQRVIQERDDLAAKVERLEAYTTSNPQFKTLTQLEQTHLTMQHSVMCLYLDILNLRIFNW